MDRIGPVELRAECCACDMHVRAEGHGPAASTDCPCGLNREHGHCLYCGGISAGARDQLGASAAAVAAVMTAQRLRALWAKIDHGLQRMDVLAVDQHTVDCLAAAEARLAAVSRAVWETVPVGDSPSGQNSPAGSPEPVSDHGGDGTGEGARAQAQVERDRGAAR